MEIQQYVRQILKNLRAKGISITLQYQILRYVYLQGPLFCRVNMHEPVLVPEEMKYKDYLAEKIEGNFRIRPLPKPLKNKVTKRFSSGNGMLTVDLR